MKVRVMMDVPAGALGLALLLSFSAQPARAADVAAVTEQEEADNRVIAARCGTPAFEKAFMKQSTALVAAGRVSGKRRPADVERSITAMRRNPVALISASADCPAQLARLSELMKSRGSVAKVKPARVPTR